MVWKWLRDLFGNHQNNADKTIHSFDVDTEDIPDKVYTHKGITTIETDKIIGSVGRAHELDKNFRYRNRAKTQRYHDVEGMLSEGKPSDPIKVVKVKRQRGESQYYVLDGHHRVAQAKIHGYKEMNADVIEVDLLSDPTGEETPEDNAEE